VRKVADRLWRIGGTGISFSLFGIGGALLAVTVFPLMMAVSPEREIGRKRVRYVIHLVFRLFLWFMRSMGVINIDLEAREQLASQRSCIIIANHPTLLDVVILMSASPNFQCVVKYQLWNNFFLRGAVSAAGFIRNDLETREFVEQCTKVFTNGDNLLIFPEGTRTIPGEFPKLFRGFANVAIIAKVDIQTVVIKCEPVTFTSDKPWYDVPVSRACYHIRSGDFWHAESYNQTPHRSLNARRLVRNIETYFRNALSNG
jgi:1-acyl-sn-glycerol-3-phosphate acyltransferase